jgi:hypothetical protein
MYFLDASEICSNNGSARLIAVPGYDGRGSAQRRLGRRRGGSRSVPLSPLMKNRLRSRRRMRGQKYWHIPQQGVGAFLEAWHQQLDFL